MSVGKEIILVSRLFVVNCPWFYFRDGLAIGKWNSKEVFKEEQINLSMAATHSGKVHSSLCCISC